MGVRQIFQCDSDGRIHTAIEPPMGWVPVSIAYRDPTVGVDNNMVLWICDECWATPQEAQLSVMLRKDPRRQQMLDDQLHAELDRLERIRKLAEKADEEK